MRKKLYTALIFSVAIISFGSLTSMDFKQEQEKEEYKPVNLKILPKNISPEALEGTMKAFNAALGVKCGFCHSPKKNGEEGLDFASDDNKMKDVARYMMKMTTQINKKHFKNHQKDGVLMQIGCATCHNGNAEPEMRAIH